MNEPHNPTPFDAGARELDVDFPESDRKWQAFNVTPEAKAIEAALDDNVTAYAAFMRKRRKEEIKAAFMGAGVAALLLALAVLAMAVLE